MAGACCGVTVSESGEAMSWILVLLLLHAGVTTMGSGGISWILLLHRAVSAIGTGDDRGGEYCIEFTVSRSIKSSFIE